MNKSLTLISRLLVKSKNVREMVRNREYPQYKVMIILENFLEDETIRGKKLVSTVINLLQVTSISLPKQKFECFLNVRSYINAYPHLMIEHMDTILKDSFFNEPRNNLSITEINNILYHWICAQKSLLKAETKRTEQNPPTYLITKMSHDTFIRFLENLISIIYDKVIYPNIIINALSHLKTMVDHIKRYCIDQEYNGNSYSQTYQNLILKILQKLIIQLKIKRNSLREIIDHFKQNSSQTPNKSKKQIYEMLFEKLPRYENYANEEERQKAFHNFLMNDEINLESVFWNNSNQKSLISP